MLPPIEPLLVLPVVLPDIEPRPMLPLLRFTFPVVRRCMRPSFVRVLLVVPVVLRFVPRLIAVPLVLRRVVEVRRILRLRVLHCIRLVLSRPALDMRVLEVRVPMVCCPDMALDSADTGNARVPQSAVAAKRHAVFLKRNLISISFGCGVSVPLGYE